MAEENQTKSDTPNTQQEALTKRAKTGFTRDLHVSESDRIRLSQQANEFVSQMVSLRVFESSIGARELSENEQATCDSALSLLRRQFEIGPRDITVTENRTSKESEFEFTHPT